LTVRYLLDTHILIWWHEKPSRLPSAVRKIIAQARGGASLLVSEISMWEIANLVELRRVRLSIGLSTWLQRATAAPLVERVGITPEIAAEVAVLPASFHRDPADRLLVATARVMGVTLVTDDSRILDAGICTTL
jgi:PIN domain nuclease of toxin-antitoxin system